MPYFRVKAIKNRKLKTADGRYFTPPDGYVVHSCIQKAATANGARELVESYYLQNADYDHITVELVE